MKTLPSTDDINNFNKLIKIQRVVNVPSDDSNQQTSNLMALQYNLKHPNNYPNPPLVQLLQPQPSQRGAQTQQLFAQSQSQLKQIQLKQHTVYHHHPYYQQKTSVFASISAHTYNHNQAHAYTHTHYFPVHTINQNSNFSAASSSTGGGTASSHAPTQRSSTTGSSLSPSSNPVNNRNTSANSATKSSVATLMNKNVRTSIVNGTKKLKTEPILSQLHQKERLTFANTHIIWNEAHWKRVVFQDERKFNLDGPDGFSYYFHDLRNYERTLSQRPRGNSVYIYLVITCGGPIHLEISTARHKPETCIATILRERPNIVEKLGGNTDIVLQDHNWIANAVPSSQEWLDSEGIKTQKWPVISHDLNIMENVWGWLAREVYDSGRKFSRKDDLIYRIREAWSRLPIDLVTNLYTTLPERITELLYTQGVYTNC